MTYRRNITIALAALFALAITACENGLDGGSDESGKINPTVTWPQGLWAARGQTLADIELNVYINDETPGVFSWETPDHPVGDLLTTHAHRMIFTPDDTETYHTAAHDVNVSVSLVAMIRIHGGSFAMGSPSDEPGRKVEETQFTVTVDKDFYLGKYEVTQSQYYEVMAAMDITGPSDNRPASVTFYNAMAFCNLLSVMEGLTPAYIIDEETDPEWWEVAENKDLVEIVEGSNGYRLPNEMQWEYACRAGTETPWHSAATESNRAHPLNDYAWYNAWYHKEDGSPPVAQTQPVGGKKPNAFGLYDMHGNASEWCWDRYGDFPVYTDPFNVWVRKYTRVVRGGGYGSTAALVRSAYRAELAATGSSGFRILRPID